MVLFGDDCGFGLVGCGLRLLVSRFDLSWLGFVSRRIGYLDGFDCVFSFWWFVYGFIVFNSVGNTHFTLSYRTLYLVIALDIAV